MCFPCSENRATPPRSRGKFSTLAQSYSLVAHSHSHFDHVLRPMSHSVCKAVVHNPTDELLSHSLVLCLGGRGLPYSCPDVLWKRARRPKVGVQVSVLGRLILSMQAVKHIRDFPEHKQRRGITANPQLFEDVRRARVEGGQ